MPITEAAKRAQKKYNAKPEIRDKLNELANRKVMCECGMMSNYSVLARHKKSKQHCQLIKETDENISLSPSKVLKGKKNILEMI